MTGSNTKVLHLGLTPIIVSFFKHFQLREFAEERLAKYGPHVKIKSSDLVVAMIANLLNCASEPSYAVKEFYLNKPTKTWFGCTSDAINRHVIGRLLDKIHDYGCSKLYLEVSSFLFEKLNIKIDKLHHDSTSFHYHGKSYDQEDAIKIAFGYSRDSHKELKQICLAMGVDDAVGAPIIFDAFDGNENDKKRFPEFYSAKSLTIQAYLHDLKYIIQDSAGVTKNNFDMAKNNNLYLVSRIPLNYNVAKEISKADLDFKPIYDDQPDGPLGCFVKDGITIHDTKLVALCVLNKTKREKILQTVTKDANEELKSVNEKIKKLSATTFNSEKEARQALDEITGKAKYIKVDSINCGTTTKNKRGRPKSDGSSVIIESNIDANVSIDLNKIQDEANLRSRHIIITTDCETKWTPKELFETYHRQQRVEQGWRLMKSPRFFPDSTFLEKPSRIEAFLWLMTLALLVMTVFTNLTRKAMKKFGLTIPSPSGEIDMAQPTAVRISQYIHNLHISLVKTNLNQIEVINLGSAWQRVLAALGSVWLLGYQAAQYRRDFY